MYRLRSIATIVALTLVTATGCGTNASERPAAKLTSFHGQVTLIVDGGKTVIKLQAGQTAPLLQDGSKIETGAASWAELKLLTGTTVKVDESTAYTLVVFRPRATDPSVHDGAVSVQGVDGKTGRALFRVNSDKADKAAARFGRFEVKSSSVVTAVMGTSFAVQESQGVVRVAMAEGRVSLAKSSGDGPPDWAVAYGFDGGHSHGHSSQSASLGVLDLTKSVMEVDPTGAARVLEQNGDPLSALLISWVKGLETSTTVKERSN